MSANACPNCNAALSPNERRDGWCDSCGKKLPGAISTERTSPSRSSSSSDDVGRGGAGEAYWGYRARTSGGKLASLGARFLGAFVDGIIALVAIVPGLVMAIAGAENKNEAMVMLGVGMLVVLGLGFIVAQIVLLSSRGQSLGKIAAGTRIINLDGSNPGFVGTILLRLPCIGPIFEIADILSIFGEERWRLADQIAGTKVVEA